jgi:hypothetical protein
MITLSITIETRMGFLRAASICIYLGFLHSTPVSPEREWCSPPSVRALANIS